MPPPRNSIPRPASSSDGRDLLHDETVQRLLEKIDFLENDGAELGKKVGDANKYAAWIALGKKFEWLTSLPTRAKRSFFAFLKNCWQAAGSPWPVFTRYVRHELFQKKYEAPSIRIGASGFTGEKIRVPVSVLVTARNNGPFLRECLQSILGQTVAPIEILYCDDGSTDDSLKIASSLPGIRVLPLSHRGVAAARNAAAEASTGEFLLHVDGDDMLTADYIERQVAALQSDRSAAFAYGSVQTFGDDTMFYTPEPWSRAKLWVRNFVNTSSLYRRHAFFSAGGWRDKVGTLWDWDLSLRVSRLGHGVRSSAALLYRRHAGSWSHLFERSMSADEFGQLLGKARRSIATAAVCTVYSGRVPELLPAWAAAIGTAMASTPLSAKPDFLILDNSPKGSASQLHAAFAPYRAVFGTILVVPYNVRFSFSEEMERRDRTAEFLSTACNRLAALTDADILWLVEDDIIVPEHAFTRLYETLTDGLVPAAAASGLYRSRHSDGILIAHTLAPAGEPSPVTLHGNEPMDIDLAGTGCLLLFRAFCPVPFKSHWRGDTAAHDWAWSQSAKDAGFRILLDLSVRCHHHASVGSFTEP